MQLLRIRRLKRFKDWLMDRSRTFGQRLQAADGTKNFRIEDLDADDQSQFT